MTIISGQHYKKISTKGRREVDGRRELGEKGEKFNFEFTIHE
jgi:hypothetical protein